MKGVLQFSHTPPADHGRKICSRSACSLLSFDTQRCCSLRQRSGSTNLCTMKFMLTILAYLIIGLVLGWGILAAVNGNFWILAVGFLAYVLTFGKSCLPKKSHH